MYVIFAVLFALHPDVCHSLPLFFYSFCLRFSITKEEKTARTLGLWLRTTSCLVDGALLLTLRHTIEIALMVVLASSL